MSIELENSPTELFTSNNVASENWILEPYRFMIFWVMGTPVPAPVESQLIQFPAFNELPEYTGFTDYLFEVNLQHTNSGIFCKVNGEQNVSEALGDSVEIGGLNFYQKAVTYSFENLNLLSEGPPLGYTVNAYHRVTAINPQTSVREIISERLLRIQFFVNSGSYATESPLVFNFPGQAVSSLFFSHSLETALPAVQELYFFRSNNAQNAPTIVTSDPLLVVSHVAIHDYFGKVQFSFDSGIDSLLPGDHMFSVSISYADTLTVDIPVKLTIFPPDLLSFFLSNFEFQFDVVANEGNVIAPKELSIFSEAPWSLISPVPSWLTLSSLNGAGNATLTIEVVNYNSMALGVYAAPLVFQSGSQTETVWVTLNLYIFLTHPYLPNVLCFTQELDYLEFSSQRDGTYIELSLAITIYKINTNQPFVYNRVYNLPLFQSTGSFHVGTVVHGLLDEILALEDYVPDLAGNYAKAQYQPAKVEASYEEKFFPNVTPDGVLSSGQLMPFVMIKGKKPFMSESQLSLLTVAQQEVMRISPHSIIGTSFSYFGTPHIVVKKNGSIIDDFYVPAFPTGSLQKVIYSYYRFDNNFTPGDVIEISIILGLETRTQRFLCFLPGLESTYFLFENSNGLIEPYEYTGRRRVFSNLKHTSTSKFKDLHSFDSKVKSKKTQSFIVNTGALSPIDYKIVDAIIRSPKVWCSFDDPAGPYLPVDSVSSKITTQDTMASENDFDVEFNILSDPDANILQ